jgi:hypothetical protein
MVGVGLPPLDGITLSDEEGHRENARGAADLIGCAAKIGEVGSCADGGDRRAGSWAPGLIDLGVGVSAIRYRAEYR